MRSIIIAGFGCVLTGLAAAALFQAQAQTTPLPAGEQRIIDLLRQGFEIKAAINPVGSDGVPRVRLLLQKGEAIYNCTGNLIGDQTQNYAWPLSEPQVAASPGGYSALNTCFRIRFE